MRLYERSSAPRETARAGALPQSVSLCRLICHPTQNSLSHLYHRHPAEQLLARTSRSVRRTNLSVKPITHPARPRLQAPAASGRGRSTLNAEPPTSSGTISASNGMSQVPRAPHHRQPLLASPDDAPGDASRRVRAQLRCCHGL
ncbi:hypothetical protein C8Q78DRAFT_85865 [Trametes maxima]|nr:hypothetical protein C8Q78DRAFT_85865 [Trametes maxima]